ncbi:MAG: T9SS type A sorting domain-containing protein, partial [Bacteroidota bacterium]
EVPKQFNLTQQEKDDLVAFLGTLTDNYFMTDPRWQNPFIIDEVAVLPIHPTDTMTLGTSHAAPKTASSPVRVLGHPVKDQLRIEWASETSGVTQIRIITLDGKTVRTHATTENEARIEMIGLPSGNYILQVQQGIFATAQQIVKQ